MNSSRLINYLSRVASVVLIMSSTNQGAIAQNSRELGNSSLSAAIAQMKLPEPSEVAPVSIGNILVGSARQEAGVFLAPKGATTTTLVLRLKIAGNWHIYAKVSDDSPYTLTTFNVELTSGAHWASEWANPATVPGKDAGEERYIGDAIFTRQLVFNSVGRKVVHGRINYEVCNEERCLPPDEVPFTAKITIVQK